MKCPTCGIGNLVVATRKLPYSYKGKSTVIKAVKGKFCNNRTCREVVLDIDEAARVSKEMLAFNKEVNRALTPIDLLTSVRERFKLNQQQAAKVFGGGTNAFSRYESGKTKPPVALIKLFQVLDKHPALFEEVAGMDTGMRLSTRSLSDSAIFRSPQGVSSLLKFDKNASGTNDMPIACCIDSISCVPMLPRKRPVIRPYRRISTIC